MDSPAKAPESEDPRDGGPRRATHYVKVSIFRFADYRHLALRGKTEAFTSSVLGKENLSTIEEDTVLPLYGVAGDTGPLSQASARGQMVTSNPLKVWTIGPIDAINEPGSGGERSEVVGTITRVQTSKNLGTVAGTFSISAAVFAEWSGVLASAGPEVASRNDNSIHKFVDSGDWVEINVVRCSDESGQERVFERSVMVGKVDSVSLSINPPSAGGCRVTIDGRDAGSVWADIPLYFNVYDPARNNAIGENMIKAIHDVSGRPDEIVMQMLGLVDNPVTTYGVPPVVPDSGLWTGSTRSTLEWRECWSTRFVSKNTRGIVSDPNMLTPNSYTPLWDFVETYGVPQLNEIWVDTLPSELGPLNTPVNAAGGDAPEGRYAYIFMREKPFVCLQHGEDSPWYGLGVTTIWMQEVKSSNLRRGEQRYNHINVLIEMPSTLNDDVFAIAPPIVDYNSVLRHGLKKLDVTLPLMSTDFKDEAGGIQAIGSHVTEYRDLILCWNILNPYYWSGSITLAGIRADIRVGDILLVIGPTAHFPDGPFTDPGPDFWSAKEKFAGDSSRRISSMRRFPSNRGDATTFYVEAVSFGWTAAAGGSQTTVTVSRGYVDKDRLPHMKALFPLWVDATDPNNTPVPSSEATIQRLVKMVELLNQQNTDDGAVPPVVGVGGIGSDDASVSRNEGTAFSESEEGGE